MTSCERRVARGVAERNFFYNAKSVIWGGSFTGGLDLLHQIRRAADVQAHSALTSWVIDISLIVFCRERTNKEGLP